jgi:hypothetical protein
MNYKQKIKAFDSDNKVIIHFKHHWIYLYNLYLYPLIQAVTIHNLIAGSFQIMHIIV